MVEVQACWAAEVVADSTEVGFDRPVELVEEVLALDLQQRNHSITIQPLLLQL